MKSVQVRQTSKHCAFLWTASLRDCTHRLDNAAASHLRVVLPSRPHRRVFCFVLLSFAHSKKLHRQTDESKLNAAQCQHMMQCAATATVVTLTKTIVVQLLDSRQKMRQRFTYPEASQPALFRHVWIRKTDCTKCTVNLRCGHITYPATPCTLDARCFSNNAHSLVAGSAFVNVASLC